MAHLAAGAQVYWYSLMLLKMELYIFIRCNICAKI